MLLLYVQCSLMLGNRCAAFVSHLHIPTMCTRHILQDATSRNVMGRSFVKRKLWQAFWVKLVRVLLFILLYKRISASNWPQYLVLHNNFQQNSSCILYQARDHLSHWSSIKKKYSTYDPGILHKVIIHQHVSFVEKYWSLYKNLLPEEMNLQLTFYWPWALKFDHWPLK